MIIDMILSLNHDKIQNAKIRKSSLSLYTMPSDARAISKIAKRFVTIQVGGKNRVAE